MPALFFGQQVDTLAINLIDTAQTDSIPTDTMLSPDAVKSKVSYKASDSIRIDLQKELVYLFGNSEVYYENVVLKAEEIEISMDSNQVVARGKQDSTGKYYGEPVFTESGQEVRSHEMRYNFQTKKGLIIDAMTHEGENYIHGAKIYKTPDDILYIKNGKYTTCNQEHPHYYFSARKLKIIPDDKIITGPANMVVEDVPTPLAIPFGFFPNSNKQKSGLIIPSPGESAQYGFFLLNGGYYWAISKKLSTQITGDFYSKGSWAARMITDYRKRYKYSGGFSLEQSTFKNSYKEFPDYSETQNFFVKWNHTQDPKARPNSVFSANVNFGNSENYQNNFNSTGQQYLSTSFNSSISYRKSWSGKPFNMSINGYHSQNTVNKTVTVRLPEVAFNVTRIYPFKRKAVVGSEKFYEKIGASYSMNTKNEVTAQDSLFSTRNLNLLQREFKNGMKHTIPISTSFKMLKYFTFTPNVNLSEIWYLESVNKSYDSQTGSLSTDTIPGFVRGGSYNAAINFTTKIYGMYQYRGKVIKAMRHVITPTIGLSYTPENNIGLRSYTDTNNVEHQYSIFENGIYGKPNTTEAGLINFGLLNNFEMKVRNRKDSLGQDTKIKLLENLSFRSSYNMTADSLNWSNIQIGARTYILKKISLNFNASVDPYALDSNTATGAVTKVNESEWSRSGRVGRLTSASLAVGFTLNGKKTDKPKESGFGTPEELEYINANPTAYIDFNIPWTLSMNYNVRYSKPQLQSDIVQTLNFSGDISLTQKWKLGFSSGYDFELKDLSYTSVDIYRDLHCWEMMFNWIPFGPRQSYLFTIKVKSAILQDLKLTRRNLPNVF
ncbi:MAG: LPS-assembly protein LptD [Flavobacteriales bacterium]|nr:LPS-assembly protein LptD [Flavobacteriales bacterium]